MSAHFEVHRADGVFRYCEYRYARSRAGAPGSDWYESLCEGPGALSLADVEA